MSSVWTPNQQAARSKIVGAAADLIARDGLAACTVRGVADEVGWTKSTVHYYFDDANELLDLAVYELLERLVVQLGEDVEAAPTAADALSYLARLFMGRGGSGSWKDGMLWNEYTAHAWRRGAYDRIARGYDITSSVFELALSKARVDDAAERGRSVHFYLLGAVFRNMVQPIDPNEVAAAISALGGVPVDPARC
jgi:AcrR family transcriptional regulator